MAVFLLILTPPAQRLLTTKVENYLEKKLLTTVKIDRISFDLAGNISLRDVYLEDRRKDTLLSGGMIKAKLNYVKLFSNEVRVNSITLSDVNGSFYRDAKDSAFNFQFILNAFTSKSKSTDTTAALVADLDMIRLSNVKINYRDVVAGSAMYINAGDLETGLHSRDLYKNDFDIPFVTGKNITVVIKQIKTLVTPEPLGKDIAEAAKTIPMHLQIGNVDLQNVNFRYDNDVSALHSNVVVGKLQAKPELIDLQQRKIFLSAFNFANSSVIIRLDKKEQAAVLVQELEQELVAQQKAGWNIRAGKIDLDENSFQFDNNTQVRQGYGIDFAHMLSKDLVLGINDFVFNNDSIGGTITKGSFSDQSGFVLDELHGTILYAHNEAYVNGLLIKTPGSEIKQGASLKYTSRDELVDHFNHTEMIADIDNSYIKVKDILYFAPALRKEKAFANPDDTWSIHLKGKGTLNRMIVDNFRFKGLSNTQIDANGILTGLTSPKISGGNFTIRKLHTNQTDISLFTGKRLSTAEINIPEEFDLNGTLWGNAGAIQTNLNINSSAGAANVNGRFTNIADPDRMSYNARIRATALNLGYILKQPEQLGTITGNFNVKGQGTKKENANAQFSAIINSADYNRYRYRNVHLNGTIANAAFNLRADIDDPNADLDITVKGNISGNSSYEITGMIDSVKTQALHLTQGPLIARGKIEGTISNITSNNIDADLLISKGLFVSGPHRLPLDTIQIKSGSTDSVNYISLRSDIANADISGKYRLNELGAIIENSIHPYFRIGNSSNAMATSGTHNFKFNLAVNYSPVFNSFIPGLESFNSITAEGNFVAGSGLNATAQIPLLVYQGNEFNQLYIKAASVDTGLQINANAASIKNKTGMALYNTRVDAIALNNNLRFIAATDDPLGKPKYRFAGVVTSAPGGNYSISLNQDNLLLNYEVWSVAAGNRITIGPDVITANNFVLRKDNQQLSINSADIKAGALDVKFSQFRLSTITAFLKTDSLLADGLLNGDLVISNLLQVPSFTGRLKVENFSMQKDTIGNIDLQVTTGTNNRHNTNATISGRGNDITVTGYFTPRKTDITTDLTVNIRQLQLSTMEGAMAKILADASGSVNGTVQIRGNLYDPDITGDVAFNNASFIPTLLGTRFKISDQKLTLEGDGFVFDNFLIQDSSGSSLVLNGKALTNNFINYELDLHVASTNFQVLNTVKGPDKLYYGKLNVTTDIRILGTEAKPRADGRITVNDGTALSFVIPQVDQGTAQRNGIVEFVDMDAPENDSLFLASYDSLNYSSILGFDVTTTIEIKKEAVFNVIIDEANGDLLNVQGEAQLSAGIDPSGKITLAGNYVLDKGSYQLAFNFLRRRFDIQKGSNIIWTGEPTTAQLDINAIYVANTAPLDLVSSQLTSEVNRNIYLQKLPFEVKLTLTGELLKPVIDFDIDLPEKNYGVSNDIVTAVQSRLRIIRQDEGEINKQVFSLLLLNRFVGENPFESESDAFSFNTYARQSVSKLLTEQLNRLAAGLVGGVDINFDVVSTDDYTTGARQGRTDLNIGLSKRLLSNRLKITVGSNFQLEGPQNSNQQSTNIAGNVAADYQISQDGRYALRFYRQNEYQGIVDGYIIETGLSFIFSVDYERFMQILRRKKNRQVTNPQNANRL
ncbi:translocation/assembly module TamB domain-containing protein [Lacibacter sp. H375]|uniref:translocation/assembly module TamB domain-containing protein n=1 Tax=Lacibacter sp. H375 TaxID=3133424 RepID=UPI0030C5E3F7